MEYSGEEHTHHPDIKDIFKQMKWVYWTESHLFYILSNSYKQNVYIELESCIWQDIKYLSNELTHV